MANLGREAMFLSLQRERMYDFTSTSANLLSFQNKFFDRQLENEVEEIRQQYGNMMTGHKRETQMLKWNVKQTIAPKVSPSLKETMEELQSEDALKKTPKIPADKKVKKWLQNEAPADSPVGKTIQEEDETDGSPILEQREDNKPVRKKLGHPVPVKPRKLPPITKAAPDISANRKCAEFLFQEENKLWAHPPREKNAAHYTGYASPIPKWTPKKKTPSPYLATDPVIIHPEQLKPLNSLHEPQTHQEQPKPASKAIVVSHDAIKRRSSSIKQQSLFERRRSSQRKNSNQNKDVTRSLPVIKRDSIKDFDKLDNHPVEEHCDHHSSMDFISEQESEDDHINSRCMRAFTKPRKRLVYLKNSEKCVPTPKPIQSKQQENFSLSHEDVEKLLAKGFNANEIEQMEIDIRADNVLKKYPSIAVTVTETEAWTIGSLAHALKRQERMLKAAEREIAKTSSKSKDLLDIMEQGKGSSAIKKDIKKGHLTFKPNPPSKDEKFLLHCKTYQARDNYKLEREVSKFLKKPSTAKRQQTFTSRKKQKVWQLSYLENPTQAVVESFRSPDRPKLLQELAR